MTTTRPARRHRVPALALLALLTAAMPGCFEYDHLELCRVEGTGVSLDGITLDRGAVAAFRIIPVDDDGKVRKDRSVVATSGDPAVLGVDRLAYHVTFCRGPGDNRWYLAIWGVSRGETMLHVRVDGEEVATIPVHVR